MDNDYEVKGGILLVVVGLRLSTQAPVMVVDGTVDTASQVGASGVATLRMAAAAELVSWR